MHKSIPEVLSLDLILETTLLKHKTNILHLISGLGVGGAERVVLDLARRTDPSRFGLWVVSIGTRVEMLPAFEEATITTMVLHASKNPASLLRALLAVRKLILRHQIDLIHAHMFHALVFAGLLRRFCPGVKVVFSPHSFNMESGLRVRLLKWMQHARDVDVLFTSEMSGAFRHRHFRVIPNGIDAEAYQLPIPKFEKFTFLAVGRLSVEKNFGALIPVVRQLKDSHSFQLLIAGDGPERPALEKAIHENGLQGQVQLLGMRSDIPILCNKAHAFLMPSLWEGLPIALLEAGAAALPVVATEVGAIPSLVTKATGYPVAVVHFAKAMAQVLSDYEEAERKGLALQQLITAKYDLSVVVNQYEDLYQELVRGDGRGRR